MTNKMTSGADQPDSGPDHGNGGGASLAAGLKTRIETLSDWLAQNAPYCAVEQTHTIEGSRERAYWHHGYLSALQDIWMRLRSRS